LAKIYYPIIQAPIVFAMVFMKSYYLIKGLSTSKLIHSNVMASLLNASYTKFYNTILIGRLMNRLSKDIYNIDLLFPNEVQNLTL
jgi:ABC-type multidrug transport system fused ATPase/permease subunit